MQNINLFTIGFKKKNAETFFTKLKNAGVKKIIDIRLHNTSNYAGFTKKDNIGYFLRELCNCEYRHETLLAPNKKLLTGYRDNKIDWAGYQIQFKKLMKDRKIYNLVSSEELNNACLLCGEPTDPAMKWWTLG